MRIGCWKINIVTSLLMRAAEITSYVATKINKNELVSLEVLMKICQVFHCDIGDICEVILDE